MTKGANHYEQLAFLKKIEGQVRGLQKMIEDERYCVDILTQVQSVIGALCRVETKIFKKHMEGCVRQAMLGKSDAERQKKADEVIELISKFKKM